MQDYERTGFEQLWDEVNSDDTGNFGDSAESDSDFSGFYDDGGRPMFSGFRKCIGCYTEFNSRVPRCKNCWRVIKNIF